jgi:nifR3 family TIM-barrel protein
MIGIGDVLIGSPFVQAALSGYSDLAMRRIARRHGASYALNEVVLDKLVVQKGRKRRAILSVPEDDHPVGGQLMGSNPDDFAPAARAMADAGYDVIDINFGCPVKKVLGRCRGGFLLSTPPEALEIIRRVIDAVGEDRPVTVKMRRGMNDSVESERHFFEILDGAFSLGVSAVTVHGRTVEQRYVGPSRWDFLSRVKRHIGDRLVFGSGDLFSADQCLRMMEATGVDGVTIARGCIGNPWIFDECLALSRGDALPDPPTIAEQGRVIDEHYDEALALYGQGLASRIMRKFGIKYSEHHPLSMQVRDAFVAVKNDAGFRAVLAEWYDERRDWPVVRRREGHGDLVAAGARA